MPNKVYRAIETAIEFRDSGGTVGINLQNLGFGAGVYSDQYDLGSGSKPRLFKVTGVFQFQTAPIVGEQVEIYIFEGDGTYIDGNLGTTKAALTADKRRNATSLACIVQADGTATATNNIGSDIVEINSRYITVGAWNASAGDNLQNTANASRIILTPVPDEVQ